MQKKKYVTQVQKRIKKSEFELFDTWQVLEDCGFVDFLFIKEYDRTPVVWNACMITTKGSYYEKVHGMAVDEGYEKFPDETPWKDRFAPIPNSELLEWVDHNPEMTEKRMRWIAERTMELLESRAITIDPWTIEVDPSYKYGTGLHITMDIDFINEPDITDFIKEFMEKDVSVFNNKPHELMSYTPPELGVHLLDQDKWVTWDDGRSRNTVALNVDISDD